MAVNKVVYGEQTLLDLTGDTVVAHRLMIGETAHDKSGNTITGTLPVKTVYTGTTEPDSSLGVDGDVYVKLGSGG